jgi:RHS repeat-associated protein
VQTGYNGSSGYIQFNGEGQLTWSATIISPATYSFYVRYSLVGANRPLAILVDGVQAATMNFTPTADWNTWTTTPVNLTLSAGMHNITLKTTGSSGPNVDQAVLQAGGGQTGVPVPTTYFVHNDQNGTPQVVTNQSKQVVWMADYQPFGKVQPGQTNSIELYSRFPGQYIDTETGLYYNYFRDYDPSIGRYLESDLIGLRGGINTYAYVEGNPMMGIDPFGLYRYTPTAGQPVNEETGRVLACMDRCVGARHPNNPALSDLVVTGATEGGHSPGSAHETAQACDIGKNSNPGLTRDDVQACYTECTGPNAYGQEEGNHFHIQTRAGRGGATGFANGVH